MAKKKLILNEGVTRRFMKLATIKPMYVSNFLREAEDEELMMGDEEAEMGAEDPAAMEEPPVDDEMEVEDEMDMEAEGEPEEAEGAEGMLEDFIKNALMPWAEEQGVSLEMAGEGAAEEEGMEEEPMEDEMDLGGEEGMEEPMEEPAPEGGEEMEAVANRGMYESKTKMRLADENKIVAEVTRRVAKRLLRESAKRK